MKLCIKLVVLVLLGSQMTYAADHLDGIAVTNDPSTDITDTFAWMQNSEKMNLIMNVFPLANTSSRFSNNAQYVFNVTSTSGYGVAGTVNQVICTFSTEQLITCSLGNQIVVSSQDASAATGVLSSSSDFRVYAGLRNDPFYFDLENFNLARTTVRDAAGGLTFDGAGCPTLDAGTRSALVNTLTGNAGGVMGTNNPPEDFFVSLNTLSIVIQVDKSLFGNGPIYSMWASTNAKP